MYSPDPGGLVELRVVVTFVSSCPDDVLHYDKRPYRVRCVGAPMVDGAGV